MGRTVTIAEVVTFLGGQGALRELVADSGTQIIRRPLPIAEAGPEDMAFCGSTARNPAELLAQTHAGLLILNRELPRDEIALTQTGVRALILSENARLDFMRAVQHFFAPPRPTGCHPSAVVAPSSIIADDAYVGPLCSIGEGVQIGNATVIHAGVHIYDGVRIGRNVTIHAGTVLGADGFGYERNEAGQLEKFPHVGGVVIEDNVEIGANTCVDRGTLGDTLICEGARIDNLVHVGHNVRVGRHAAVVADVMIGGGTSIGDYAWVAPSACLRDRIRVGQRAVVGLAALVTRDVPDGVTVMGAPARPQSEQKRLLERWNRAAAEGESESNQP
jgi:UDP-3-O-[3-hydroxymyristoyl] glucosamine N-acyltransferase